MAQAKVQKILKIALLAELGSQLEKADKQQKQKRIWVRDWIGRRQEQVPLYVEIQTEDQEKFFCDFRLYPDDFEKLLARISPLIEKQDTHMINSISSRLRLQATLRYLTGPASFSDLEDIFRIPKSTLSKLIPEVCEAIWHQLNTELIVLPQDQRSWLAKAKEFEEKWQYPFVLAAMDGKHVEVQAFQNSGSLFYNYKGRFSIVLFALVDANYNFLFVDIGRPGSENDARIWQESLLKQALDSGALNFPPEKSGINYHFIGDDIFPLTTTLLKPFARSEHIGVQEKIFNYRHSRARRVVENSFGILASRFWVLRNPILQNYDNSVKTVKACIGLHNYILKSNNLDRYCSSSSLRHESDEGNIVPGSWEQDGVPSSLYSLQRLSGNRSGTKSARDQRENLAKILMTDNLAPWQFHRALRSQ